MVKTYRHWHLHLDNQHILWLIIDKKDASVNSLDKEVLSELDFILNDIAESSNVAALVIRSGKKSGFIAGADISQFTALKDEEEAFEMSRQGQMVFDKLSALKIPTVAMIEGFCLGGGMELALACRSRVARDDAKPTLGLPEVKLGLIPGWEGTFRLPRLIGAKKAMQLILTGEIINAKKAQALGVIDEAVPERVLERAVLHYALDHPPPHQPTWWEQLSNRTWIRPLLSKFFYRALSRRIKRNHYPAPYTVVDNWKRDGAEGEQAIINEAKSIAHLMVGDTSRNLVRVFFLRERLKNLSKGVPIDVKRVHVIGAGTMGGDIAAWCAFCGYQVTLQDRSSEHIAPAIKRAYALFKQKLKIPRVIDAVMDRITPIVREEEIIRAVEKADVVIEAVFENLEVKQAIYKKIEPHLNPNAILATNTSSLPLEDLCQVLKDPSRLVGLHFFNPVAKMELVEVVVGKNTDETVIEKALSFVGKIHRLALPVKSSPGFLVNRVLMPYLMESMLLYEEGVPAQKIDEAAVDFGMPMGPLALADKVGLDVCLSVAEILTKHLGGTVPVRLREMVDQGYLGQKSGRGFYLYRNKKPIPVQTEKRIIVPDDIIDRLILRLLNEAIACLREKVVADADLLDAGMIFGTGFAPFRGGPIQVAKKETFERIRQRLKILEDKYGPRFKPDEGWTTLDLKKTGNSKHKKRSGRVTKKESGITRKENSTFSEERRDE